MTRKCLQCNNDFEAKRDSAKYCSDNCRVKWNYKHGKKSNKVTEQNLKVLYNAVLEAIGNFPKNAAFQNEIYKAPALVSYQNTQSKPKIRRSFDWYKQARFDCETADEWNELKEMIKNDEFLTESQKFSLTQKSV